MNCLTYQILFSGFEVVDRGCCGTGMVEVSVLCNRLTPVTCPNVSQYIFWDSFHPTELGYKVLVHEVLKKYISSFFWVNLLILFPSTPPCLSDKNVAWLNATLSCQTCWKKYYKSILSFKMIHYWTTFDCVGNGLLALYWCMFRNLMQV